MATTLAFVGDEVTSEERKRALKAKIHGSLTQLIQWLEAHDYRGYDTFDGLSSRIARPLTFETRLLRTVLQQGVRRFPLNVRPLLGIPRARSTKGMGFVARGYIRLHQATGELVWADRAREALAWLVAHQSAGYSGACWGNHFDYQSRTFYLPSGVPTVVWTSLIGHAFLLGASFSWSVAIIVTRVATPRSTMFQLMPWCFAISALFLLPLLLLHAPHGGIGTHPASWAALACIGLIASPFGTWCVIQATATLPAVVSSVGFLTTPAISLILANLLLGEPITVDLLAGSALIIFGVGAAAWPTRR